MNPLGSYKLVFFYLFPILVVTITDQSEDCPGKGEIRLNLRTPIQSKDLVKIIELSEIHNFSKNYSTALNLSPAAILKAQYVVKFGKMIKHICDDQVPPKFVDIAANIIMLYFNNSGSAPWSNATQEYWRRQAVVYTECTEYSENITFFSEGGLINSFQVNSDINRTLTVGNETTESEKELDYVVETFWYMFLGFTGSCYSKVADKTGWLANLFVHFKRDFLEELQPVWKKPVFTNFGLVFGDVDLYETLYNLRACVRSVFQAKGIEDRLFFRPLRVQLE